MVVERTAQLEAGGKELSNEIIKRTRAEEELLLRNRELSVLYAIGRAATQSLNIEETLTSSLEATLGASDMEVGGIYLLEPDGEMLRLCVYRGISEQTAKDLRLVKLGEGLSGRAAAEKKPVVLDVQDYPSQRLAPYLLRETLRSLVSIPLLWAGQAFGAMNLSTRRIRAFPSEELELLTAIGQQLGSAIKNAQLHETVQHELAERQRAEEALQQRSAQLEQANQELEAFSYSVSHDLRAPLRAIDGFSAALVEDYGQSLAAGALDYLGRIRAGVGRMSELIEALLLLSRVTQAEMTYRRVSLSDLAQAIAEKLKKTQPGRAVDWRIGEGLTVEGDPQLLSLALENLIGNAWKFTSKTDRARIEFGLRVQRDGKTVFFIKDNGAGFDIAYVDKLFVAFQRLHSSEEFEGTGIGLATVQRIIHRHGGRVWAEGEVGRGATFYFSLK